MGSKRSSSAADRNQSVSSSSAPGNNDAAYRCVFLTEAQSSVVGCLSKKRRDLPHHRDAATTDQRLSPGSTCSSPGRAPSGGLILIVDFTSLTSFKRTINDVDYSDFLKVFSF